MNRFRAGTAGKDMRCATWGVVVLLIVAGCRGERARVAGGKVEGDEPIVFVCRRMGPAPQAGPLKRRGAGRRGTSCPGRFEGGEGGSYPAFSTFSPASFQPEMPAGRCLTLVKPRATAFLAAAL